MTDAQLIAADPLRLTHEQRMERLAAIERTAKANVAKLTPARKKELKGLETRARKLAAKLKALYVTTKDPKVGADWQTAQKLANQYHRELNGIPAI